MAIPVIDISQLHGEERDKILAEIAKGNEEWGFIQLINHGIPMELLERVKNQSSECYKAEREEGFKRSKVARHLSDLIETGSGQRIENADWEDVFEVVEDNQFLSNPTGFRETMEEYMREMKKLAEELMEAMDENLGLERGYIKRVFQGVPAGDGKPCFGTKVSHFPPCPRPDLVAGLREHTDAGGVIFLFQGDSAKGLQLLKDGKWIDVEPIANAIMVNTGDQIEVISNGQYKSNLHRVFAVPDTTRRAVATFYNPSLKATIGPATQLVNKTATPRYPKFTFGDYMDVYNQHKFLPK